MGYKTEGYVGEGVGPIFIPKTVAPDYSEALTTQVGYTNNPTESKYLALKAALEKKYANSLANAQNLVQSEAQAGQIGIYNDTDMQQAMQQRRMLSERAALEYNAEDRELRKNLGLSPTTTMKSTSRWDL